MPIAHSNSKLQLGQAKRRLHGLADPLGGDPCVRDSVSQGNEDSELVPAGPGQHVARSQRAHQPPGEGDQKLVAGQRAETFIDSGEAQHVDDQDPIFDVAVVALSGTLDCLGKGEPVGQAGEAVAEHFGTKRSLGLDLGRAVDHAEQAARRSIGSRCKGRELEHEGAADCAVSINQLVLVRRRGGIGEEGADKPAALAFRIMAKLFGELRRIASATAHFAECLIDHLDPQPPVAQGEDRRGNRQGIDEVTIDARFRERPDQGIVRPLRSWPWKRTCR